MLKIALLMIVSTCWSENVPGGCGKLGTQLCITIIFQDNRMELCPLHSEESNYYRMGGPTYSREFPHSPLLPFLCRCMNLPQVFLGGPHTCLHLKVVITSMNYGMCISKLYIMHLVQDIANQNVKCTP